MAESDGMTALLRYDVARRAVAEAKTFDEVREWEDKAAAVREYSRRARDRAMELDALAIQQDARRRRGELLLALKAAGELVEGRRKKLSTAADSFRQTLAELDVTPDESSRDQKIAAIPLDSYQRLMARCRAYAEKHPEKHSFNVLRPPDEPINGARSVMSSRQEPDDSLDYFPTPPWATRALIERVLLHLGINPGGSTAWEPACGEGHIAAVLAEYFREVHSTDIHDYGWGFPPLDFLAALPEWEHRNGYDWIITNPPFGDKTEAFVLRALDHAQVGVAMLVRLQWLETIGRYERLFRDRPPTLIAFFCERVNLCKGRWDPDGTTATAYIWLVWIKGRAPRAPFWIPPGCRENLSRPDDVERFTAHPVKSSPAPVVCDEPFDPETGEIAEEESPPDDGLEIPAFLRRTPEAAE